MTGEAPDTLASLSLEHRVETDQNSEIIYSAIFQIFTESLCAKIKDEQIREFLKTMEPDNEI